MTPWHERWLCQFSYLDLPGAGLCRQGERLAALSREMLSLDARNALACGHLSEEDRKTLEVILDTPELGRLVLMDFMNNNAETGLVAYAFRAPDGTVYCIFRGSETRGCGVPTSVDWLDNFLAPFFGSVQYADVAEFARRNAGEHTVFSGHSKGAHNALYALATLDSGRAANAVTFNGQGFSPGQLNRAERARLAEHGVNYVVAGDLVGSLLYHPERRVFVKKQGTDDAHALSSFSFDANGHPVPGHRPLWSVAVEWTTRWYLRTRQAKNQPQPAQTTGKALDSRAVLR